jgi:hypothetical protein
MTQFRFSRWSLMALLINNIVFGGCVVQLLLGKHGVILIALAIFTFGVLVSTVGRAYVRPQRPGRGTPGDEP